jgi:uncharacterized metal-binding protein YceD (DUF177 family)
MITIRLSDIPAQGIEITEVLSLELINNRMNEAPGNDIHFTDPPSFQLKIAPNKGGLILAGTLGAKYSQPCGRCLETVTREISSTLKLTLKPKNERPGVDRETLKEEWLDGVGIVYFHGEHIDLEDILQENLILAISPFNNEHDGCMGFNVPETDDSPNSNNTKLSALLNEALNKKK